MALRFEGSCIDLTGGRFEKYYAIRNDINPIQPKHRYYINEGGVSRECTKKEYEAHPTVKRDSDKED